MCIIELCQNRNIESLYDRVAYLRVGGLFINVKEDGANPIHHRNLR